MKRFFLLIVLLISYKQPLADEGEMELLPSTCTSTPDNIVPISANKKEGLPYKRWQADEEENVVFTSKGEDDELYTKAYAYDYDSLFTIQNGIIAVNRLHNETDKASYKAKTYFFWETDHIDKHIQLIICNFSLEKDQPVYFRAPTGIKLYLSKKSTLDHQHYLIPDFGIRFKSRIRDRGTLEERYFNDVDIKNRINVVTEVENASQAYRTQYSLDFIPDNNAFLLSEVRYEAFDWKKKNYQSARLLMHDKAIEVTENAYPWNIFNNLVEITPEQGQIDLLNFIEWSTPCFIRAQDMEHIQKNWRNPFLLYSCFADDNGKQDKSFLHALEGCPVKGNRVTDSKAAWNSESIAYLCQNPLLHSQYQAIPVPTSLFFPPANKSQPNLNFSKIYPAVFQTYFDPYIKIKPPANMD